jgi:hypothetical protein
MNAPYELQGANPNWVIVSHAKRQGIKSRECRVRVGRTARECTRTALSLELLYDDDNAAHIATIATWLLSSRLVSAHLIS